MRVVATAVMIALALPRLAADPAEVLFRVEAEDLPTVSAATVAEDPQAVGGAAVVLAAPNALLGAQVTLDAGEYTLLVSAVAPDAAHDAIYVNAPGGEERMPVGRFGELVTLARTFVVAQAGEVALSIRPDPQEVGVAIDQVGLARGAVDGIDLADLVPPADAPALAALEGAAGVPAGEVTAGTREVRLAALPDGPRGRGLDTLLVASFDASADADWAVGNAGLANLSGAALVAGRWGHALDCTAPETDLLLNLEHNHVARAGTIECRVRSGEANIWADGQERYLLHLQPRPTIADDPRMPLRVEVVKRTDGALHLVATGAPLPVDIAVPVSDLDPAAWHHVALSWDSRGDALQLWLTVDGAGQCVSMPCGREIAPWSFMRLANLPLLGHYAHVGEHEELGGYLDDLHISDETLAGREVGAGRPSLEGIDLELALAAEDAAAAWFGRWAELQLAGAWGPWVTPNIEASTGIYRDWTGQPEDARLVRNKYGSSVVSVAYDFAEAFQYTGDERWRQVAANAAEFYFRGQDARGYWYQDYYVDASGRVAGLSTQWARVQDGYQSQPFLYLLYWHRLTGDRRALDAARRCADFVLSIENPNGSWPGTYDVSAGVGHTTGPRGVEYGCEYNDYATTDPLRMMITMYHLTGDEKYLRGPEGSVGIIGIGQWMFDTQLGEGAVRGWCQQYDQDNQPVWSRAFEAPVIEPRVLNRFIHPQTVMLSLMTDDERYLRLLQESYDWYRSVEVPGEDGGWYYQYLADGTPVTSDEFETVRIDPNDPNAPRPSRDKLQLTAIQRDLEAWQQLGLDGLRESFEGPVTISDEEYAARRRAAAEWLRANQEAVRAEVEQLRRDGQFTRGSALAPVNHGLLDEWLRQMRVARGVAPPEVFLRGGRGPWEMGGGGWRRPVVIVGDWFEVPLEDPAQ